MLDIILFHFRFIFRKWDPAFGGYTSRSTASWSGWFCSCVLLVCLVRFWRLLFKFSSLLYIFVSVIDGYLVRRLGFGQWVPTPSWLFHDYLFSSCTTSRGLFSDKLLFVPCTLAHGTFLVNWLVQSQISKSVLFLSHSDLHVWTVSLLRRLEHSVVRALIYLSYHYFACPL